MKKLMLLLAALLALGAIFALAEEAEPTVYTSGEWEYVLLEDGTAEIKGYNGKAEELIIPAEIDGHVVTAIGDKAFYRCRPLTSITIPDSVTAIGDDAFNSCHSLTSITIPDSVTAIGTNPFRSCSKLTDIIVSPDHPTLATIDGVLFDKVEKTLICYPYAYTNSSYTIPQGIRVIGDFAFGSCRSLTSITIPDSVTVIGDRAFYRCDSLTSITIPDSVTDIRDYAFFSCSSLTSITIPDSVMVIGNYAFSGCYSLTSITIPDSVMVIGNYAFVDCSFLTSITIPDSVTVIGDRAFSGCYSLTSITIPDNVTTIGDSAFSGCHSLTSITIPDNVKDIGTNPFSSCIELTDIIVSPDHPTLATIDGVLFDKVEKMLICYPRAYTNSNCAIPHGIRVIGDSAFLGCRSLTNITIPDSVTVIGDSAFDFCDSLTSITIPDSVTAIGDGAFYGCYSLTSITVSRGSYAEEWALANGYTCTYMKPTGLSHGDLTYRIQADGMAIIIGCTTEAAALEVPAAIEGAPVTAIGAYAFENCATLTAMTLPDTIAAIDDTAFEGCGRITFTVPRNSYAAQWCKTNGLRYTYPDSLDWLLD